MALLGDSDTSRFERRNCPLCEKRFTAFRKDQKFCSPYCRNKHWRDAHRDNEQACVHCGQNPRK